MSINSEIARLKLAKSDLYTAITAKGGVLTSDQSISDYAQAVDGIEISSGGSVIDFTGVNVTANDLLSGVVAVNASGVKVTGNIETVTATLSGSTVTVPVGFIAQQQTFTVTPQLPETNFTALDLKPGATALDGTGTLIDGAMPQATLTPELSFIEESGYYEFHCKVTESGYVEEGSSVGEVKHWIPRASCRGISRDTDYWEIHDYKYFLNTSTGYVLETSPLYFHVDKLSYTVAGLTVELGYECMCMGETITVELPQVSFTAEDLKPGVTAINTAGEVVEGNMPYAGVSENDRQIIIQSGYVPEKLIFNKSGGSFVKVTEFIAPHDAYTTVTAINVTGWGLLYNEDYGEEEDFSKYNGVYAVTPATANEQELTDRVFKHPTEKMYIFFGQETENGEGDCWFFASSTDDTSAYGALAYKNGKELPNGQFTWYKIYSDSPVLTTTHVTTEVPAQPLVLSGASAKLENGEWVIGEAVGLSGYDEKITPLKHGIYAVSDNQLVGDAIAFHTDMYMPQDGLLAYFPMDSSSDIEVDVVSGIRVKKFGKGIMPGAEGADGICWENTGKGGLFGCNTSFKVPTKNFTLSAYVYLPQQTKYADNAPIIDFGSYHNNSGVGLRASIQPNHNRWEAGLRIGMDEGYRMGSPTTVKYLDLDKWYLFTVTYEEKDSSGQPENNLKCYVDGSLYVQTDSTMDSGADTKALDTFVMMFSRVPEQGSGSEQILVGKIDEVMLWDRVLTADEIATLVRREETNG